MPPKERKDDIQPPPQSPSLKRPLESNMPSSPAKKQSKWTPEEDSLIIELRLKGEKWEDISKKLPGRSAISCRLHYQNYLERRCEWDEEKKNKLARLYERFKQEMWTTIATEMGIPWRAAENMHWHLGEHDMARRAGVVPFSLSSVAVDAPQARKRSTTAGPSPSASAAPPASSGAPQLSQQPVPQAPPATALPRVRSPTAARRSPTAPAASGSPTLPPVASGKSSENQASVKKE